MNNRRNNNQGRRPRRGNKPHMSNNQRPNNKNQHIQLPDPELLQELEYVHEGATEKLFALAKEEQNRRHHLDKEYLAYYKKSLRIGQLLGAFVFLAIVVCVTILVINGFYDAGILIATLAFCSIMLSNLFFSSAIKYSKSSNLQRKGNRKYRRKYVKKNFQKDPSNQSNKVVSKSLETADAA